MSLYFQRMCLVVSTDTKLDKLHSSITCCEVFFGWAFMVQVSFCSYCSVGNQILVDPKHFQCLGTYRGFLRCRFLKFWVQKLYLVELYSWPTSQSSSPFLRIFSTWWLFNRLPIKSVYETKVVLYKRATQKSRFMHEQTKNA